MLTQTAMPKSTDDLRSHANAWISPEGEFCPVYDREFCDDAHYGFVIRHFEAVDNMDLNYNWPGHSKALESMGWIHLSGWHPYNRMEKRATRKQREVLEEWYMLNHKYINDETFVRDMVQKAFDKLGVKIPEMV